MWCVASGVCAYSYSLLVLPFRVSAQLDYQRSHLCRLYHEQRRLAVLVCCVDVAALLDQVAQDLGVSPGGGGVKRGAASRSGG